MAISMVRQPSTEPNIDNISDIVPFRYAYGGQNGYVKGKGRELEHEAIGNEFTIKSGRVVLDGVESDIDVDGVNFRIDVISETRYYTISYVVNLGNNTTTLELQQGTSTYPTVERGFDLTENPEGTARLLLYRFTATSGIISNVEKVVQVIEYTGDALDGYDISKGTIEKRFADLGFKQGSATLNGQNNVVATQNELKRQGNYVLGRIVINNANFAGLNFINNLVGTIPPTFRPKEDFTFPFMDSNYTWMTGATGNDTIIASCTIYAESGEVWITRGGSTNSDFQGSIGGRTNLPFKLFFGYEANPL